MKRRLRPMQRSAAARSGLPRKSAYIRKPSLQQPAGRRRGGDNRCDQIAIAPRRLAVPAHLSEAMVREIATPAEATQMFRLG